MYLGGGRGGGGQGAVQLESECDKCNGVPSLGAFAIVHTALLLYDVYGRGNWAGVEAGGSGWGEEVEWDGVK